MWADVFSEFRPGLVSEPDEIARAEAELGFALPASYRSFCRDCGAGRIGGHLRLYTPLPIEAADLVVRAELIAHSIATAMGELSERGAAPGFALPAEAPAGLMDRACFFGETEGGDFVFFDVTPGFEEYDIFVLAADLETVRHGGADLRAFLRGLQGLDVIDILGEEAAPLPARFLGDDAAALAALGQAEGAP
ncbi:SMI1/KNR4 family protein [Methylobacterium organophilum]|uniref:Knr4/Smi1-like domain-containing protein n=1 Tax=Methylobacterium organophilum TaxID=410 RepID=A0ABQ4T1D1_METOR|nr:SMI1/KNR4 family protein [Methylobacterium organophilum]GJE25318.1 hypothetical protein LKMONMHP_0153 [Methylobacterium organophilum]